MDRQAVQWRLLQQGANPVAFVFNNTSLFTSSSFPSHICHGELGSKELAAALTNKAGRKRGEEGENKRRREEGRREGRMCLRSERAKLRPRRQFAVKKKNF